MNGTTWRGTHLTPRASAFIAGSPNVSANSSGVNAAAQAGIALSSTGIWITMPRSRSGATAASSSVTFAPSEVPPTTAWSRSRWSSSASACRANSEIE